MAQSAVFVVAKKLFRDEEYAEPKKILENGGIKVLTASHTSPEEKEPQFAEGRFGLKAKIDLPLENVDPSKYDAIVFIGGPGSREYFNDPVALELAKKSKRPNKIVASICSAGGILANAGILKGKKATAFSGEAPLLLESGAIYKGAPTEIDKSTDSTIITADGPEHAKDFGHLIVKELTELR